MAVTDTGGLLCIILFNSMLVKSCIKGKNVLHLDNFLVLLDVCRCLMGLVLAGVYRYIPSYSHRKISQRVDLISIYSH